MKENRTMDAIHKSLLKRYHTLCGMLGLGSAAKDALLDGFGVDSSRDLCHHDLIDLCAHLSAELDKRDGKESMDTLRKRVIAVVGRYLLTCGRSSNIGMIKGTACRAAGIAKFNNIPRERLRSLYGAFQLKIKDIESVNKMYGQDRNNNKR